MPMIKLDHMMQSPPIFCQIVPGCDASISSGGGSRTTKILLGSQRSQEITMLQYSGQLTVEKRHAGKSKWYCFYSIYNNRNLVKKEKEPIKYSTLNMIKLHVFYFNCYTSKWWATISQKYTMYVCVCRRQSRSQFESRTSSISAQTPRQSETPSCSDPSSSVYRKIQVVLTGFRYDGLCVSLLSMLWQTLRSIVAPPWLLTYRLVSCIESRPIIAPYWGGNNDQCLGNNLNLNLATSMKSSFQ